MDREFRVIDAFTNARYAGNPAAVLLHGDGLTDAQMTAIAAEFNLSETTFILPPTTPDADVRFRWFTPNLEVTMCGHATIAGVHALMETGRVAAAEGGGLLAPLRIETRSGVLPVQVEPLPGGSERVIWLELPRPRLVESPPAREELGELLGLPSTAIVRDLPTARTQENDLIVMLEGFQAVNEARPDFPRLKHWSEKHRIRGLCIATVKTLTPSISVQSRFFAPAYAVDEDPVTGSVHGPLCAYLVKHGLAQVIDGYAGLHCVQAKAGGRAGLVRAVVQLLEDGGCAVTIGGQAVTVMRGTLQT